MTTPIHICIAGAMGRMGRRVMECAASDPVFAIAAAIDLPDTTGLVHTAGRESGHEVEVSISDDPVAAMDSADVLIDFSAAAGCIANVRAAAERGKPVVLATTGLSAAQEEEVKALARESAIVYASNTSVGVNLLFKLTREVASLLGPEYNIEIVELHHNQKADSPSGTAVTLGKRAAEGRGWDYDDAAQHGREGMVGKRPESEIGMHAVRGGDIPGEHTVYFVGPGERIELTHRALTRDIFARGALRAAQFAVGAEPGLYDMQDVLGLR